MNKIRELVVNDLGAFEWEWMEVEAEIYKYRDIKVILTYEKEHKGWAIYDIPSGLPLSFYYPSRQSIKNYVQRNYLRIKNAMLNRGEENKDFINMKNEKLMELMEEISEELKGTR